MSVHEVVGTISDKVIKTFKLNFKINQDILCGESNRNHMKDEHDKDYEMYGDKIEEIIAFPDYIAKHPKKDSIEYIKKFKTKDNDYVLVAVRATGSGVLFARTLFVMSDEKVRKYKSKNALIPY